MPIKQLLRGTVFFALSFLIGVRGAGRFSLSSNILVGNEDRFRPSGRCEVQLSNVTHRLQL